MRDRLGQMLRRAATRLRRDERGATAVEFALVIGPFMLVLGVIIETGLMLFTEYVIQSSVQEAARQIRTGQAQSAAMTQATLKTNFLCDTLNIIINCNTKVYVYVNAQASYTALQAALPSMLTVGPSYGGSTVNTSYNCGQPSQAVAIVATYDWEFTLPYFMGFFGNMGDDQMRRLVGFAMFRNEPFPSGTNCS